MNPDVPAESTAEQRIASKGTPGDPVAADGRHHIREVPCPDGFPERYLTQDGHMWLPLWPDLDLQKVAEVLPDWKGEFPKGHGGP